MSVGIVGLGLMGGSLARDLVAAGLEVVAADADPRAVAAARSEGVVSAELDPAMPPPLVVLAVPVRAVAGWLQRLEAPARTDPDLVITDTGSTKRSALAAAARHGVRFVGSHPVAGSHESGWGAGRTGLFQDADVWVCPPEPIDPEAVARVEDLWRQVGARPRRADAAEHDRFFALASHLPQVAATALGRALGRAGLMPDQLGPGGRDTTRLAASDPAMWTDILLENADQIGPPLEALIDELRRLARAVAAGDAGKVRRTLEESRAWKTSG